ncbi:BspA family leucine-rich repeat surface protein, partial [Moritella viscosa]
MKFKILTVALLAAMSLNAHAGENAGAFYKSKMSGAIVAPSSAKVNDIGIVDGQMYTVVDETMLRKMIADGDDVTRVVTTNITNMSELFKDNKTFNQNIGYWDTSNVTDMSYMFEGAEAFNQPIGHWNTSNVTRMSGMFWGAEAFNQLIGHWNISKVTDMYYMFRDAEVFNQDISRWNTANVINMVDMFNGAEVFNQD